MERVFTDYLDRIDETIKAGPYEDTWESLSSYEIPRWFRDSKFGIFIHWGVYSVPAFFSEWYPKHMYDSSSPVFEHHLRTYGPHKKFGYKDFIPMFKGEKFDPKHWCDLIRESGAGMLYLLQSIMTDSRCTGAGFHHGMLQKWDHAAMCWGSCIRSSRGAESSHVPLPIVLSIGFSWGMPVISIAGQTAMIRHPYTIHHIR